MTPPISVVIPTFHETGNIGRLVAALRRCLPDAELIVVDDCSGDGTVEEAREALPGDSLLVVHERTGAAPGLAVSVRDGIGLARGRAVAVMDADFSHDPELLPVMVANLAWFDCVSGSRYVHGGGMYSDARYSFSHLFNLFARYFLGTRLTDHLSGFLAMRRETLEALEREPGLADLFVGYGDFHIRILFHLVRSGARILEIPSWYQDRSAGESKTRFLRTLIRYIACVVMLRLRYGWGWRKRRAT